MLNSYDLFAFIHRCVSFKPAKDRDALLDMVCNTYLKFFKFSKNKNFVLVFVFVCPGERPS